MHHLALTTDRSGRLLPSTGWRPPAIADSPPHRAVILLPPAATTRHGDTATRRHGDTAAGDSQRVGRRSATPGPRAPEAAAEPVAAPLRLEPTAREILVAELEGFVAQLRDEPARDSYAVLLEAVRSGTVPEHVVGELERFLDLGLETGRFRRKYGGYPEDALVRLYHRTPRGAALAASTRAVSQALDTLDGHTLESIGLTAGAPGSYTLTIDTDRAHVLIRLTRGGARVDTIEVGV